MGGGDIVYKFCNLLIALNLIAVKNCGARILIKVGIWQRGGKLENNSRREALQGESTAQRLVLQ